MNILFFVVVAFLCMLLAYEKLNRDLFNPTFLLIAVFLLSGICTFYNLDKWKLEMQFGATIVLCLGICGVLIGSLTKKYTSRSFRSIEYDNGMILNVPNWKYLICILLCLLIFALTLREVNRIASLSTGNYSNILYNYKLNVVDSSLEGASIKSYVAQANKLSKGIAYVFAFVYANNRSSIGKKERILKIKNSRYLIPGVIYCAQCIIKGGRYETIAFLIGLLYLIYYFWRRNVGWKKEIPLKTIAKITLLVMGVVYLFWISSEMLGRISAIYSTPVDYLSKYFGGSISNFNSLYCDSAVLSDGNHETFAHLVRELNNLGFTDTIGLTSHEFRKAASGISIGNAYSAIRNYYHDFGSIGVIIMCFLYGFMFTDFYYKPLLLKKLERKKMFCVIFYSTVAYMPVFFFFTDYFFPKIGQGYLIELILLWLSYYLILRLRFKRR